jgi:hypothetical protein
MAHQAIRRYAAATAAAALVLIAPGTALAATSATSAANTPPSQPLLSDLTTGSKACAAGADRPYVSGVPQLHSVLRDPDATDVRTVSLKAQFEASWTDAADALQTRTYTTTYSLNSGSTFYWTASSDIPADTVVSWRVRATDGTDWSPWSSDGGQGECEFIYDSVSPDKPAVSSAEYPDDQNWYDGVGTYAGFTFDSPSDDVVAYRYSFTGGATATVQAPNPGDPASIRWMPEREGVYVLAVQSVDRAGRLSTSANYYFKVAQGRAPVGAWTLADAAGSPEATVGSGVTFGAPGPSGTDLAAAAEFDGTAEAYVTPGAPVADTTKTFAVSAWARPVSVDQDLVAADQGSGVSLGLTGGSWSFALGGVQVSGGSPSPGEWAHLVGVYDAELHSARLYVNGTSVGTADASPAASGGDLRIGPGWHGTLADIRVWDRVVVPAEVTELAARAAQRHGYWQLNSAPDGAAPDLGGGRPLTLGGDASIYTSTADTCDVDPDCVPAADPLAGTGNLVLDGDGDYASTATPVVDTDDSFTLTALVRLDDPDATRDMAVLSLPGEHTNAVVLRYAAATHSWELAFSHADSSDAAVTTVRTYASPGDTSGVQALAVVYDDSADQIRLYVDRRLTATAQVSLASADTWKATGGLQIGRALTATADATGWGDYLDGQIDEVRAYAGVLSATAITQVGSGIELPDM